MNFTTPTKVTFGPPTVIKYCPDAPVMHRHRSYTNAHTKVGGYVKVLSPSEGGVYFIRDLLPAMKVEECDPKTIFSEYIPSYMKLVKVSTVDMPRFMDIPTTWDEIIYMLTQAYKFPLVERSTPFEFGPKFCDYDPATDDFEMMFQTITVRNKQNLERSGRENPMQYDPIFADLPDITNDDIDIFDDWFDSLDSSNITVREKTKKEKKIFSDYSGHIVI